MLLGYHKGEKVYYYRDNAWKDNELGVLVFKHKDIINVLNKLFKQAEKTPDKLGALDQVLHGFWVNKDSTYYPHRVVPEFAVESEIRRTPPLKKKSEPRLNKPNSINQNNTKIFIVKGGLYNPPEVVPNDLLSGEFNEWSKRQRANVNHNEVKP
jgi:hypothetical protein